MKKSIFLFFAAILCATSAWAGPSFSGGYVYFHNKGGWSKSSKQLCIGKSSYTETRSMTVVNNTQLWYNSLPTSGWTDATYMAVINNSSSWNSGNWGPSNLTNATHYTKKVDLGNWGFNSGAYQMLTPSSGSNNATLSLDWVGGDISAMNKTITIKAKVSTDKGATYAEKTSPGTLTASSFKFTAYNSCTSATSLSSGKITCGYTANTTLTAQDNVTGYTFKGWYDSNGTQKTTSKTLSINPTEDATYYAYYVEETHDVTISYVCGSETIKDDETKGNVGVKTTTTVKAPTISEYTFSHWTIGDGVTNTTGDDTKASIKINTKSTGSWTLTANYNEPTFAVRGTQDLMGVDWIDSDENKMQKLADKSYKLTKENVTLPANTYEYRIAKNGDWWDKDPNNHELIISKAGIYNVTFLMSADFQTITAETELIEEIKVISDCYVSGNPNLTGGPGWQGNEFKMEYNEVTETYSYTLEGLAAMTEYELKVVCGHTWFDYEHLVTPIPDGIGTGYDNSIGFRLAEAGNVIVTYNASNGITISGNFYITPDYYIAGTLAGGWDARQKGMVKISSGEYSCDFPDLAAGQYEFKITNGWFNDKTYKNNEHTTLGAEYEEVSGGNGNNVIIKLDKTTSITVHFHESQDLITFEGLTEKINYYVVGLGGNWDASSSNQMEKVGDGQYAYDVNNLTAGSHEFKVNIGNWDDKWGYDDITKDFIYPETSRGSDGNAKITLSTTKDITIKFNSVTKKISFDGLVEELTYTVVGDETNVFGQAWNADITDNEMTLQSDGTYKWVKTGINLTKNKTIEYKVYKNHDYNIGRWPYDGNNTVSAPAAGTYTFVVTLNLNTNELTGKLYLELGGGNNATALTNANGVTLNVKVDRSFTAGDGYYTLCLPFNMNATLIGEAYKIKNVTEFANKQGLNIGLIGVSTIEAGKPYLIIPDKDMDELFVENVTINNIDPATKATITSGDGVKVTFTGIINGMGEKTDGSTEYYVGDNGYLYNGTVDKLGLRAFFTITDEAGNPTPIRARVVANENVETGVEDIITTDAPAKVIENGQLIIIRDGVKYNVQGVRL